MRKVNIRELRKNLAQELSSLPFIITRRGEEIAVCTLFEMFEPSVHKGNDTLRQENNTIRLDNEFNPVPKPK